MRKDYEKGKLMSYMGCKYGEEFDYVESYAGQAGKNYSTILVKSREHKEREALARLSEKDGRRYYEDNYLAWLLKDELERIEGDYARRCFGECEIHYKLPQFVFPFYFGADMTAEEFLRNPCAMPQFHMELPDRERCREKWEEKLHCFRKLNAQRGYKVRGALIFPDDKLLFSMDEKGNFRYMRWLSDKSA